MQVPPVTRYFMGITFLMSFCMTYQIISYNSLFLIFEYVGHGQVWRLFTTYFFAGPFSMNFVFSMMMNYYVFTQLEKSFENKEADLATLILFNSLATMLYGYLANEYMVLHNPFVFSLLYVVCKLEPDH